MAATRVDLVQTLRGDSAGLSSTGRRLTLKNGLVIVQVAVSVVLLGGTMLFVQMLGASRSVRAGFTVDGVALLQTDARYASTPAAGTRAIFDEMQRRISAIPGVESVAVAAGLPMEPTGARVIVEGTRQAPAPIAPPAGRTGSGPAPATSRRSAFRCSSAAPSTPAIAPTRRRSRSSARRWPGATSAAAAPSRRSAGDSGSTLGPPRPSGSRSSASPPTPAPPIPRAT
jgi:hypothetical protein